MISIIVCSINEWWRNQLQQNIARNIGCDHEFLYIDNTIEKKGICAVYNILAKKAQGEYLCFVHEDVIIETKDWGNLLIARASDKATGVIGFAGAGTVAGFPYWNDGITHYSYYVQRQKDGSLSFDATVNPFGYDFKKVAVLDGMFLFCRKDVWTKHPFDDKTFNGFHLYDIDFCLSVAQEYNNYVGYNTVINHFSTGSPNKQYFDSLILFYKKWQTILPYSVYPEKFKKKRAEFYYRNIKKTIKEIVKRTDLSDNYIVNYLKEINGVNSLRDHWVMYLYIVKSHIYKYFGIHGF
ncbi:MAG: glycosyltransferase family protein [Prevotella sp.]|jgi:hypothetical protein|nr:glycosyltransferase family protein [Prevotella sp.]